MSSSPGSFHLKEEAIVKEVPELKVELILNGKETFTPGSRDTDAVADVVAVAVDDAVAVADITRRAICVTVLIAIKKMVLSQVVGFEIWMSEFITNRIFWSCDGGREVSVVAL